MSLSKTTLGDFELYTIETGDIKLDGGAMFGVVPKTLWSRGIEPDEKNRISMTMRCLLIKSNQTGKVYLIDNGVGNKFNEKMMDIYQIDFSEKTLEGSLEAQGFTFGDVTDIIFTHLHFDHCGGTSFFNEDGKLDYTFQNVIYHINKRHWETATNPNAREQASFLKENIEPLKNSSDVNLLDDYVEFEPGLSTLIADGHTLGQQLPKIETDGKTIVFVADLLPTHVHLPLPWVMGYDMRPIDTLNEKKKFLDQAVEENWYLFLEHDLEKEIITIGSENGRYFVIDTLTLSDI
ncbi:MAG: MBL fold metallo-hydrolase [Balneolaceae bacterium]|nr:MBL fold metallo-hydrolase [Balneolaceae bacterium]MBO6546915.1 MBL fold metallo-hydrolase [Balneolaceae bacterium]MBO6649275.1 MBL fold metallo-hydrolase [Balneolaceae bacterium]